MSILTNEQKSFFLNLTIDDITAEFIESNLADKSTVDPVTKKFKVIPSKYKTYDTFILEKGEYFNKEKVTTNIGLFIYNKLLIEEKFSDVVGYVNTPIDKNVQADIESKLSDALLNDRITVEDMATYLNRLQWLSKQFNSLFSGSFTMKTLKPIPSVVKRREELLKQNKDALDAGDVITAVKIESELKDLARKEIGTDHGMDLYKSGAKGSFDNNYKAISLIKGPIFNPVTGKYDIVKTNLIEGIEKKDVSAYANAVVTGEYPKAIGTQTSGYFSKQLTAAFQGIVLDEPGSDCGSKGYLEVLVTPWIKKDLLYRNIIENGKIVQLDNSNIDKYLNKKVKLRSPMFCISDNLCRTCAGSMYDKLGINNIGLTTSKVSSTLLNLSMKKFHDSSASVNKIDVNSLDL